MKRIGKTVKVKGYALHLFVISRKKTLETFFVLTNPTLNSNFVIAFCTDIRVATCDKKSGSQA